MIINKINKIKQIVASFFAALMYMTTFISIPVKAETGITILNYDNYRVEYNVVNEWDGYQWT